MNLKVVFLTVVVAAGLAACVFLHPGVAYAASRLASSKPTPFTQQAGYTIDPMHTSVYFEITHLGLAKVHGRISKVSGKIHEDGKDLTNSSVEFAAQVDSIDTAVPPRDGALKSAEFFDVAKYPELSFKSTNVAKAKSGFVVTGDLTIKGVTKSISIPFQHHGPLVMKGMGDQPARIGIDADPVTIKRSDFGIGSTQKLPDGTMGVNDEVIVRISLEATLDKQ